MLAALKNNWLGFTLLAVAVGLLAYFIYWVFGLFSSATDNVKAASIGAFVSVSIFSLGRFFEQSRELKSKSNSEKVRIYEGFFEIYFSMFSASRPGGKPKESGEVVQEFLKFQKELMLWGSDGVIAAYLDFRDALAKFDANRQDDLSKQLGETISVAARLMIEMRKDVGYRFTNLSPKTLARLQLAHPDTDPQIKNLMSSLK